MSSLAEYLRGPFLTELDEVHKVRDTADEVLDTLQTFKKDSQWAYELTQDARWETVSSHSTSAMILFAIGVAVRNIRSSILVPSVASRSQDDMPPEISSLHAKVQGEFKADIIQFRRNIEMDRSTRAFDVSWSSTYGPDDPFTVLWLLELLKPYESDRDLSPWYGKVVACAAKRVDSVFKNPGDPTKALDSKDVVEHLFPTLRVVQLYKHLRGLSSYVPPSSHSQLEQYLRNRLHLHLSYFAIPNSSYDAAELAFAMEAILLLDANALDSATVDRCREVLVESQARTPYWRPLRPFIASAQGKILLPLSVEIANSLLRSCELLEGRDGSEDHVSRNMSLFRKYTEWLFTRKIRGATLSGEKFVGWHSEHADDPRKIHPWETSQVQIYLLHYESVLRRHRASTSLSLMNLRVITTRRNDRKPLDLWSDLADKKSLLRREPLAGLAAASDYAVFQRITDFYIKPRNDGFPTSDAHYSMLLYGPQGTGKTDLAENIARCLGRPFISISPSDFIVGGGALVEARAQAIFDVLGAQTDVVILLDEIDRLILDRDSGMYQDQSDLFQFMTPGMLTKFRNLRRPERCVFIVSTNYAERIDPAIKRAGRIDDQYLVMPPDATQRGQIIRTALDALPPADTPSDLDLGKILKETVLFIPGELQKIARQALRTWNRTDGKAGLVAALEKQVGSIESTIRLSSYKPRFRWANSTLKASQEPYTEFLMLMYLLFESGKTLTQDEESLWSDLVSELRKKGDLRAGLSLYLKDETVLGRVLANVPSVSES